MSEPEFEEKTVSVATSESKDGIVDLSDSVAGEVAVSESVDVELDLEA